MHHSPTDHFWSIPELREQVLPYLNNRSLANLRLVSRAFHSDCRPFFRLQVDVVRYNRWRLRSEPKLPPDYLMASSGHNVNALIMEIPSAVWPQPQNMLPWHQHLDGETGSIMTSLSEISLEQQPEEETDIDLVPNVKDLLLRLNRYQPTIIPQIQATIAKFRYLTTLTLVFDSYYEQFQGSEFDILSQDPALCVALESLSFEGHASGLVWKSMQRLLKSTIRLRSLSVNPILFMMEEKEDTEWKQWARQVLKAPPSLDTLDTKYVEGGDSLLCMPQLTSLRLNASWFQPLQCLGIKQGLGLAFPNLEKLDVPSLASIWDVGYKPIGELFPKLSQLTFKGLDTPPVDDGMLDWIQDFYKLHSSQSLSLINDPHRPRSNKTPPYHGPVLNFKCWNLSDLRISSFFKALEALPPSRPARFHTLGHGGTMFPDKVFEAILASPVCGELRVLDAKSINCFRFVEHYLEQFSDDGTIVTSDFPSTDTRTTVTMDGSPQETKSQPHQWRIRLPFASTLTGLHLDGCYFHSEEQHKLEQDRLGVFLSFLPMLVDLTIGYRMWGLSAFDQLGRRAPVEGQEGSKESEDENEWRQNERPLLERLHIWVYSWSYRGSSFCRILECKRQLRYKFRLLEDLSVRET